MGWAKRLLEEQAERGWSLAPDDHYVCAACVGDEGLAAVIEAEAAHAACSYCQRAGAEPVAIPVNRLFEVIASGIRYELTDPVNELPHDGGEYVFGEMIVDSDELLASEIPLNSEGLIEQFIDSFSHLEWVRRDFFALPDDEALMAGWKEFAQESIRARATPEQPPEETYGSEIPPHELLEHLGVAVAQAGVVSRIPAGTAIYRTRVHRKDEVISGAAALGAPPPEQATLPNRMSPAGQPTFYGAFDEETCIAETFIQEEEHTVTTGTFTLSEEIAVLDLTKFPALPSLFDEQGRHARRPLMFLRAFADEISRPIPRDGGECFDYIPTQLVIEYFRTKYEPLSGSALMGLIYPSSRNGHPCVVLFAGNGDAIDRASRTPADSHLLTLESQQTRP